jgi:hypothetical protein
MARRAAVKVAQAWIELKADDPEATSALSVARAHLPVGARLAGLRRMRLVEISGALPGREQVESLLHHSTQFYNPHKEQCSVRMATADIAPLQAGERAVLVMERAGFRRGAAERWWRHETGENVEVREGTAWAVRLSGALESDLEDLALVRGRRQGLLCNPHSQDCRLAEEVVPLPWLCEPPISRGSRAPGRAGTGPKRSGR